MDSGSWLSSDFRADAPYCWNSHWPGQKSQWKGAVGRVERLDGGRDLGRAGNAGNLRSELKVDSIGGGVGQHCQRGLIYRLWVCPCLGKACSRWELCTRGFPTTTSHTSLSKAFVLARSPAPCTCLTLLGQSCQLEWKWLQSRSREFLPVSAHLTRRKLCFPPWCPCGKYFGCAGRAARWESLCRCMRLFSRLDDFNLWFLVIRTFLCTFPLQLRN